MVSVIVIDISTTYIFPFIFYEHKRVFHSSSSFKTSI